MTMETKTIIRFEKEDLEVFNAYKKAKKLSLRKIGKELGISSTYIDDMIKGRRTINEKFFSWLVSNHLVKCLNDKLSLEKYWQ